jgi:hypothetical protein
VKLETMGQKRNMRRDHETNPAIKSSPRRFTLGCALAGLSVLGLAELSGCSGNSGGKPSGGGTPPNPADYIYLTGNWQIETTPTTAPTPFTALAGFINEQGQNPGVDDIATAALQATPSSCYVNAVTIPMQGSVEGKDLHLLSFSVNGQFLNITATKDATATHLTGAYSISGGCADGAAGTITGTQYASMTGTYSGSISGNSAQTLQLKLSQFTQGTGDGVFLVTGSATVGGVSCLTQGTLASQDGSVIGSTVKLTMSTNDASGAQLVLSGSIDPTAATLTLSSVDITGGSCAGSLGAATLTQQ